MIHPSYTDLMEVVNSEVEPSDVIGKLWSRRPTDVGPNPSI